jgi:hypothetical protein
MSDARDAVADALALNKRLAANLLVRKQELEAELAAGPPDEAAAERLNAELALVNADYQKALAELAELRRLGGEASVNAARAVVSAALNPDPLLQSHEERALENARAGLAELGVEAELAGEPPAPPRSREQADADARAEFEALRARRDGKKTL